MSHAIADLITLDECKTLEFKRVHPRPSLSSNHLSRLPILPVDG